MLDSLGSSGISFRASTPCELDTGSERGPRAEIWAFPVSPVQELTAELEEKQDIFRSLQDTAELLSLENHPAKQTVEVRGNLAEPWGSRGSNHLSWNWGDFLPHPTEPEEWWQDISAVAELFYFGKWPFPDDPHLKLRHKRSEQEPFPQ